MKSKRIVVKIGTNVITNDKGRFDLVTITNIVDQICKLKSQNYEIILVSSGAIGYGMGEIGLIKRPDNVLMRQVCASVGQSILMAKYYDLFKDYEVKVAQVLITYNTLTNSTTYGNMKNNIEKLLELGIIPVINENDAIATDEIEDAFGDNDLMSAKLTAAIGADTLMLLTSVDGIYNGIPGSSDPIREIKDINHVEVKDGEMSSLGSGGIKTKLEAARVATSEGTTVFVGNGRKTDILRLLLEGSEGTKILPK
tara:strand:- start:9522 stop:10283 length:762 start_codon:yes stop_codon:yes gene_type:complete